MDEIHEECVACRRLESVRAFRLRFFDRVKTGMQSTPGMPLPSCRRAGSENLAVLELPGS